MLDNKIIIKYALLITLLIGAFFFLSKLLGYAGNEFLRFLNLLFVLLGIHEAIKVSIFKNKETNYATNLGLGIATSALAVLFSIIGVVVYTEVINPEFFSTLQSSFLIGGELSMAEIIFTLALEGMASSVVGSFIIMQFYKNHDKKDISNDKEKIF
jgi:hypothetical protein